MNCHKKLIFLCCFLIPFPIWADSSFELINGDRITGKIISEDALSITVAHPFLGNIQLLRNNLKLDNANPASPPEEIAKSPQPKEITDSNDIESSSDQLPLWTKALDWINPLEGWSSKIFLGYTWTGGETHNQDFIIQFTANQKFEDSNLKLKLRWDYGTTKVGDAPQVTTNDRYIIDFRYRRDIASRLFFQYEANYRKDIIRNIDHRLDQNIGFGLKILNSERFKASITPLLTLRYREIGGVPDGWKSLMTIEEEFLFKISKTTSFKQIGKVTFEPNETESADYELELVLENKFSEKTSLSLRYEYNFTHVVGVGVENKQQQVIAGLGYSF